MLYRFELAFCGAPQDVGFLQGLADVGIPTDKDLYEMFNDLPVPKLPDMEGQVSFWFTEAGLRRFQKCINMVIQALEERDWQMLAACMDLDLADAVYRDEYQIAFPAEYVKDSLPTYQEISDVTTLKKGGEKCSRHYI